MQQVGFAGCGCSQVPLEDLHVRFDALSCHSFALWFGLFQLGGQTSTADMLWM